MKKIKFQPSIYIARKPGETMNELIDRVTSDPRCLPDQKHGLLLDRGVKTGFDDCCLGIWMEQPPLEVEGELK